MENCKGSGRRPRANTPQRRDYGVNGTRYKCFYCKKFLTLKMDGSLVAHKAVAGRQGAAKTAQKARKVKGHCAECQGPVYEFDYLCEGCRTLADTV